MVLRTPIPQFLDIDFMNDGEILTSANLNDRMLHKLDDKCEFLKSNLEAEVDASSRLALLVGEDYRDSELFPCWVNSYNFGSQVSHHSAIEGIDRNVSRIDINASSHTTRLNNVDIYIGEPSGSALTPSWLTPNAFALAASHHDAIQGLDDYAKANRDSILTLATGQDNLDTSMSVRITDITNLTIDVGALQTTTGTGATGLTSRVDTSHSQLSLLIPLATVEHTLSIIDHETRLVTIEVSQISQTSNIERLKSQINFLRTDAGVGHSLAPIPGWPI